MTNPLDINKILETLPHRYPVLLIDRVLDYQCDDYIVAIKNVSINEPFFTGHFPEVPIMPGVLTLEALAQAGGVLYSLSKTPSEGHHFLFFFAGLDNVKFKQLVVPGDQLRLEVKLMTQKRNFWRLHGEAYVGDTLVCSADLMSAVKEVKSDK